MRSESTCLEGIARTSKLERTGRLLGSRTVKCPVQRTRQSSGKRGTSNRASKPICTCRDGFRSGYVAGSESGNKLALARKSRERTRHSTRPTRSEIC